MPRLSDRWPKSHIFRCGICNRECSNLIVDHLNERPRFLGFCIDQRQGGQSSTSWLNKESVGELIKVLQAEYDKMW